MEHALQNVTLYAGHAKRMSRQATLHRKQQHAYRDKTDGNNKKWYAPTEKIRRETTEHLPLSQPPTHFVVDPENTLLMEAKVVAQ